MYIFLIVTFISTINGHSINEITQEDDKKIPSFIKICHRKDPDLNECVRSSVEQIKPYLKDGIPDLHIPACEPLILPEIIMNQGKGSVSVQSKYTNVKVYGPTDFELLQVKVDMETDKVKVKLRIPKLEMTSNYTISGRILMLPIAGSGICKGNYSEIEATAMMVGERYKKDGEIYIRIKDFFVDFTIGHASIYLSNLFDGDPQLGKAMNDFLNDNWKNVALEMKPILEKTVGDLFKSFSNRIYTKYPLDLLLPP